jgi:hypothetical protein
MGNKRKAQQRKTLNPPQVFIGDKRPHQRKASGAHPENLGNKTAPHSSRKKAKKPLIILRPIQLHTRPSCTKQTKAQLWSSTIGASLDQGHRLSTLACSLLKF